MSPARDRDGTTIGIWINPTERELVKEFDETMNSGRGTYSRSTAVKEAMETAIMITEVLERRGYGDLDARERRATVRQALLDHLDAVDQRT